MKKQKNKEESKNKEEDNKEDEEKIRRRLRDLGYIWGSIMKKEKDGLKVDYGTVSLPLPLIEKIKKRISGTGMTSVSAYVSFILRQILSSPEPKKEEIMSKNDEEAIRKRLKMLGY